MLPIRDDTPRSTTPFINYFLIALNIAIFFFEWTLGPRSLRDFEFQFAFIPHHVEDWLTGSLPAAYAFVPFLSSMFLHASWPHVIVNMWFLRIFGDNVEDRLGHFGYLIFYLLCGAGANLAHFIFNFTSPLPAVTTNGPSATLANRCRSAFATAVDWGCRTPWIALRSWRFSQAGMSTAPDSSVRPRLFGSAPARSASRRSKWAIRRR